MDKFKLLGIENEAMQIQGYVWNAIQFLKCQNEAAAISALQHTSQCARTIVRYVQEVK